MDWVRKNPAAIGFGVAVVVILLALWMAGVFGGKKTTTTTTTPTTTTPEQTDALPGAISNVQISMSGPDDEGATTEAYTSIEEMEGVSVTISFTTPESTFGYGTLQLNEYIISLGSSPTDGGRGTPQLVLVIPRAGNSANRMKMVSAAVPNGTTPQGVALSGGFNSNGNMVTIALGSDLWVQSGVILDGKVYLGIDYTTMGETGAETPLDFSTATADAPVTGIQSFLPDSDEGVSLTGDITDTGSFVIDPNVQESVNAALNIQITEGNVGGDLYIRKTIGLSSRFLISPASDPTIYWAHRRTATAMRASIVGTGAVDRFIGKPIEGEFGDHSAKVFSGNVPDYWTLDQNWYNYAITEQRSDGWVRLALISNFEEDVGAPPASNGAIVIKKAQFPVLHTLSLESEEDDVISFVPYEPPPTGPDADTPAATWFKFVAPLDGSSASEGFMSICVKRVNSYNEGPGGDITSRILGETLTVEDLFLVRDGGVDGDAAQVQPLSDISNIENAVFTKRQPVAGNAPEEEVVASQTTAQTGSGNEVGVEMS